MAGVEIDLGGITCVDHAGEQALPALWQEHRRFVCTSLFARALCEGLGIPVEEGTAMNHRCDGNPSLIGHNPAPNP